MLVMLKQFVQGLVWIAAVLWAMVAIGSALLFIVWLIAHLHELQMIIQCST